MSDEKDGGYQIYENNANAIRSVLAGVEGTIGPKGLDTMLMDQFGEVVITNDGYTTLSMMEVTHPIAKMLINAVKAQQNAIGDGTTTCALYAGEMVLAGLGEVRRGVPVAQVIAGLQSGLALAQEALNKARLADEQVGDEGLYHVAYIAGREHPDVAQLIIDGIGLIGREKLLDEKLRLADMVKGIVGADNEVFLGVLLSKEPQNSQMPKLLTGEVPILLLDDALEPERVEDEALTTESGFRHYMAAQERFAQTLDKLISSGVKAIFVDRSVHDLAQERLTDAGIMVVNRIPHREMQALADHTGGRIIKHAGLSRSVEELTKVFGYAQEVRYNDKQANVRVIGGSGEAMATILVGAATREVLGERERIAKDAAASVQAALQNGYVVGGGAAELAIARLLEGEKMIAPGMQSYGLDCVIGALRRPFMQIIANAGYNPLEKLGDVNKAQLEQENNHLAINCETGEVADLCQLGVIDPLYVKAHALQVAGEIAESILRINMIVKKKPYQAKKEV